MNHFLSHLKLRQQIWLSKLFPAVVLTVLVAVNVYSEWTIYKQQDKNHRLYVVAEQFNQTIRALQAERGMSTSFLSSGEGFDTDLFAAKKTDVDNLLLKLKHLERNPLLRGLFPNAVERIYFDDDLLESIASIRAEVMYEEKSQSIDGYTDIIRGVIKLFESKAMLSKDANLTFYVLGLGKLLWASEYAGREQFIVSNILKTRTVGLDSVLKMKEVANLQSKFMADFMGLSSLDEERKLLLNYDFTMNSKDINLFRESVITVNQKSVVINFFKDDHQQWLEITNKRINLLQGSAENIIRHIIEYTQSKKDDALTYMLGYLAAGFFVLVLSGILSYMVTRRFVTGIDEAILSIQEFQQKGVFIRIDTEGGRDEIARLSEAFNSLIEEQSVSRKELLLSSKVFDLTDDGIIVFNADKKIILVNHSIKKLTGDNSIVESNVGLSDLCALEGSNDFVESMWSTANEEDIWRDEFLLRNAEDGDIITLCHLMKVMGSNGELMNYIATLTDISSLKESQALLEHQAKHDALTGLPNRRSIDLYLEHEVKRHERNKLSMAIMFMDLNDFKYVNDTLGHEIGDEVLIVTAKRIEATLRNTDMVARQGGDEFLIILSETKGANDIAHVAESLIDAIKATITVDGKEVRVGVSIGISQYPLDSQNAGKLISNADMAMYQAKKESSSSYSFFTTDINAKVKQRFEVESDLWSALDNNELYVCYQPKVNMQTGEVIGAEALVRWQHPVRGFVPPNDFIPIAEASGLISKIGAFVTLESIKVAKSIAAARPSAIPIAVNVAPGQFRTGRIADKIKQALILEGVPTNLLQIEITETAFIKNDSLVVDMLNALSDAGIKVAIDDFGTGYSSLSYLQELPIDIVKIDASFIWKLFDDNSSQVLVETIINMAKGLNKSLVAEGVETQEQADWLMEHGCDIAQGYFYSKPLSEHDFLEYVGASAKVIPIHRTNKSLGGDT